MSKKKLRVSLEISFLDTLVIATIKSLVIGNALSGEMVRNGIKKIARAFLRGRLKNLQQNNHGLSIKGYEPER